MDIESPAFAANGQIPAKYTCDGENLSPPLLIWEIPAETQSVALVMEDMNAFPGVYTHWTVWNVLPKEADFPEHQIPLGAIEGTTSAGEKGYAGPCPPKDGAPHRYVFRAYALSALLELPPGASVEELERALDGHVIEQAELSAMYG